MVHNATRAGEQFWPELERIASELRSLASADRDAEVTLHEVARVLELLAREPDHLAVGDLSGNLGELQRRALARSRLPVIS